MFLSLYTNKDTIRDAALYYFILHFKGKKYRKKKRDYLRNPDHGNYPTRSQEYKNGAVPLICRLLFLLFLFTLLGNE